MKNVESLPSYTTICQKFRKYIYLTFMDKSDKDYVMKGIDQLHDHIDIQKWKDKDVFYQHKKFINCNIGGIKKITKQSTTDSGTKQEHINIGVDFYTDKVQVKTDNILKKMRTQKQRILELWKLCEEILVRLWRKENI